MQSSITPQQSIMIPIPNDTRFRKALGEIFSTTPALVFLWSSNQAWKIDPGCVCFILYYLRRAILGVQLELVSC